MRGAEIIAYEAVKRGTLEIDEQGRIWRLREGRGIGGRNHTGAVELPCERRRAERRSYEGYLAVHVCVNYARGRALAHRLVWVAANGPIPPGLEINHKNGIKDDNRLSNLEVVTPRENVRHAMEVLGKHHRGELNNHAKLTAAKAREIRNRRAAGESLRALAAEYRVHATTILRIGLNRIWPNA